jgi:hypothetical protein
MEHWDFSLADYLYNYAEQFAPDREYLPDCDYQGLLDEYFHLNEAQSNDNAIPRLFSTVPGSDLQHLPSITWNNPCSVQANLCFIMILSRMLLLLNPLMAISIIRSGPLPIQ